MLLESVLVAAFAAGVQPPPEPLLPTTIERGLIDRACRDSADGAQCRDEKLASLRADFGKDLTKLKADDRKNVDATCSPLLADSALKGREPYFECMLAQLTAIKTRRTRNAANAAAAAPAPADAPAAAPETAAAPDPAAGSRMSGATLVAAGVGVLALVGVAFVVMRARGSKMGTCSKCGAPVAADAASELCDRCRNELAENLRRTKAEQAEHARLAAEEARKEAEQKARRLEVQRQRELEERRVREYDEARQRAHAEKVAEASRPNEPEPQPAPSPFDPDAFDPHAILGVKPGAAPDTLKAAYDAAKKKYDPELVGHLSEEVQAHYREKAAAVEKAYQQLTGSAPAV